MRTKLTQLGSQLCWYVMKILFLLPVWIYFPFLKDLVHFLSSITSLHLISLFYIPPIHFPKYQMDAIRHAVNRENLFEIGFKKGKALTENGIK